MERARRTDLCTNDRPAAGHRRSAHGLHDPADRARTSGEVNTTPASETFRPLTPGAARFDRECVGDGKRHGGGIRNWHFACSVIQAKERRARLPQRKRP